MQYKSKHEKLKPHYPVLVFRIAALLVCLILITTYLLSGAYSKFFSSASCGDSARVARFSPDFTSDQLNIENVRPGYSREITFSVQNYSGENLSETAMKYKIILKTTGNIPLTFTLLYGETELQELISWECDGTSGEQTYEHTDDLFVFGAGVKQSQDYTLLVEWKSNNDGANLDGANLDGAGSDGANLDGANLDGAGLDGANLDGAGLDGAGLDGANLDGAGSDGAGFDDDALFSGMTDAIYLEAVFEQID